MRKLNLKTIIAVLGICAFALSSCSTDKGLTVTKRKHRGGYHVEWHGNKKVKKQQAESVAKTERSEDIELMGMKPVSQEEASLNTTPAGFTQNSGSDSESKMAAIPDEGSVATAANTLSKADYKKYKKEFRKNLKHQLKNADNSSGGDTPQWLIIVLCFLLPPLAVGLVYGIHLEFWLSVILTLLGWIPGIIYALVVIL